MPYLYNDEKISMIKSLDYQQNLKAGYNIIKNIDSISDNILDKSTKELFLYHINQLKGCLSYDKEILAIAVKIRKNFKYLIVIGIGGSALVPMLLFTYQRPNDVIKIIVLDTIDPENFYRKISDIDLNSTAFLVISKSGKTLETVALTEVSINLMKNSLIANIKDRFYFITSNTDSKLQNIAKKIGGTIINHEAELCGRFSSFSHVGLLSCILADLDIESFCKGAEIVIAKLLSEKTDNAVLRGAALLATLIKTKKNNIHVTMPYIENLISYTKWWAQVVSESLGKKQQGITPITAIGPQDQHSQLQLYLEGPRDKAFTLIYYNKILNIKDYKCNIENKEKSLRGLISTQFQSLKNVLTANNIDYRLIMLESNDIYAIGGLIAHSILETIIAGLILKINPFNQPGVEDIKKNIIELLR